MNVFRNAMIGLMAAMGLTMTTGWAVAQTVQVQSGEHPEFTRLVLDVGVDRTVELDSGGPAPILRFDPPISAFDLSDVFNLIPRTRLTNLVSDQGLVLDLACACPVSISRYAGRYAVVDIGDPSSLEANDGDPAADDTQRDDEAAIARRLAAAEALPDLTRVLGPQDVTARPSASQPAEVIAEPTGSPDIAIEDAARLMAEQLARAAASGLLEAADGRPLSDADPTPPPVTESLTSEATGTPPEEGPQITEVDPPPLPLRAETAVDIAQHRSLGAEPQTHRLTCSGVDLDVRSWSAGAGVDQGLGSLRRAIYDDRDRPQRSAIVALAQHYLYYGFGAEARFWLRQVTNPPDALIALSHLVDETEGRRMSELSDAMLCDDSALIWRFLDQDTRVTLTDEVLGRVQRQTAALPVPLRDHVAPRIARRLQDEGAPEAARNIRDMLVRGQRVPASAVLHLDLDLGLVQGDGSAATREALALALRDDGADPPRAMAQALRFDRQTDTRITQTRLIAADALLREYGAGPDTHDLWQEVVLAHAAADHIDHVLFLLAASDRPETLWNDTMTRLFAQEVEAADTLTLLLLARSHGVAWIAQGSDAGRARVSAIAHLRARGFGDAADILRDGQRLLILPTRPAPEAPVRNDARNAWLGEDWTALQGLADGPHGDLATRMVAETADPSRPDGIALSAMADRVSDTRALRQTVAAILENPSPQATGAGR